MKTQIIITLFLSLLFGYLSYLCYGVVIPELKGMPPGELLVYMVIKVLALMLAFYAVAFFIATFKSSITYIRETF